MEELQKEQQELTPQQYFFEYLAAEESISLNDRDVFEKDFSDQSGFTKIKQNMVEASSAIDQFLLRKHPYPFWVVDKDRKKPFCVYIEDHLRKKEIIIILSQRFKKWQENPKVSSFKLYVLLEEKFPKRCEFGLKKQMRACALKVLQLNEELDSDGNLKGAVKRFKEIFNGFLQPETQIYLIREYESLKARALGWSYYHEVEKEEEDDKNTEVDCLALAYLMARCLPEEMCGTISSPIPLIVLKHLPSIIKASSLFSQKKERELFTPKLIIPKAFGDAVKPYRNLPSIQVVNYCNQLRSGHLEGYSAYSDYIAPYVFDLLKEIMGSWLADSFCPPKWLAKEKEELITECEEVVIIALEEGLIKDSEEVETTDLGTVPSI